MERGAGQPMTPLEYKEWRLGIEQNIKDYMNGAAPDSKRGQAFNHNLNRANFARISIYGSPEEQERYKRALEEKDKEIGELEKDTEFKTESTQIKKLLSGYQETYKLPPDSSGLPAREREHLEMMRVQTSTNELMRIGADVNLAMVYSPQPKK
jgi:hypothetical protein